MKTVAIIQARMGSTRLPGKVMKDLCGRTVLEHVLERVRACGLIDLAVVATTTSPADDVIKGLADRLGAPCFRGSEDDVLKRYYEAAVKYEAGTVVRVTSDCPLIDPALLCGIVEAFNRMNEVGHVDYLTNALTRTFPRGLDVEVFGMGALERAHKEAVKDFEREHVTPYINRHPGIFTIREIKSGQDLSGYRWTLDTEDDFRLITEIYKALYKEGEIFDTHEVLELLKKRPELNEINAHVKQKDITG